MPTWWTFVTAEARGTLTVNTIPESVPVYSGIVHIRDRAGPEGFPVRAEERSSSRRGRTPRLER
jgi:hypothetical protein